MPTYEEDLTKVKAASAQARALTKEAGGLYSSAETFSPDIMKIVRENRAARGMSELEKGYGQATSQLVTEQPGIRARTADVNPLQVDLITAKQRGQTLGTLASLGAQEESISGTIQDVIGAGTAKVKAMALLKQYEAKAAADEADELLAMAQFRADQEEREFQRKIFERTIGVSEAAQKLKEQEFLWEQTHPKGTGSGLTEADLLALLGTGDKGKKIVPTFTVPTVTSSSPNYSPQKMEQGGSDMSGQYYWDASKKMWRVPVFIGQAPNGTFVQFDNAAEMDKYERQGYTTETRLFDKNQSGKTMRW